MINTVYNYFNPNSERSLESADKFHKLTLIKKVAVVAATIFGAVITPFFLCLGGVALFQLSVKWLSHDEYPKISTAKLKNYTGAAKYIAPNGDEYTGKFKNGLYHGWGELLEKGGNIYAGNFVEGKKCGEGTYWVNGRVDYFGNWENDQKHGRGEERCIEVYYDHGVRVPNPENT